MRYRLEGLLLAGAILWAAPAQARITRIAVEHKDAASGRYEKLSGHAYGELDPKDPLNIIVTDLQFAPRNAHGMVEYSATFSMMKPLDMANASGVLVYLVPNRGGISLTGGVAGDFQKSGHVLLASGWQGDIAP